MWPERACPLRRGFSQRFSQRAGEQLWWMKASGFSRSGCAQAQGERPEPGKTRSFPDCSVKLLMEESELLGPPRPSWTGGFRIQPDALSLPFVPNSGI